MIVENFDLKSGLNIIFKVNEIRIILINFINFIYKMEKEKRTSSIENSLFEQVAFWLYLA